MNNIKEDKNANYRNVKYNRFKLIKKIDNKGSTLHFLNGSCNNLPSVYSKNSNQNHNHNHNQSSRINNSTIIDNNNYANGKGAISISSYMNKNIRNNHKKYISSFYVDDEMSMNMNKSSMNKSMRIGDKSKNQKDDKTNANNKKEDYRYKRAYSKKRTEKEIQNKINKMNKASFGKVNKYEKKSKNYINNSKRIRQNNNNNNDVENKKEHNNRFNRVKTVGHLRKSNVDEMNITKEKINKEESSKHQNKHINEKDKKNYTNLYDKYLNKYKDKISKVQNNKNYKNENENKTKEAHKNKNLNINKKHNFRKNLTCVILEKRNNNKSTYRKNRDYSRGEILKEKTDKRDYRISGKSIENRNYNRSKNKRKATVVVHHGNKKEAEVKNKVRSKSVVKFSDRKNLIKKDVEDECDIETILYGEIKPSKDEDPFDDVDSVVKKIDFDSVNLNTKNIFIEENEKYKIYSNNFDNFFDKLVKNKNTDKKEKNIASSNSLSENTSDSSKKIK